MTHFTKATAKVTQKVSAQENQAIIAKIDNLRRLYNVCLMLYFSCKSPQETLSWPRRGFVSEARDETRHRLSFRGRASSATKRSAKLNLPLQNSLFHKSVEVLLEFTHFLNTKVHFTPINKGWSVFYEVYFMVLHLWKAIRSRLQRILRSLVAWERPLLKHQVYLFVRKFLSICRTLWTHVWFPLRWNKQRTPGFAPSVYSSI